MLFYYIQQYVNKKDTQTVARRQGEKDKESEFGAVVNEGKKLHSEEGRAGEVEEVQDKDDVAEPKAGAF